MTSVFDGSDRVGMMWRLMACDMMKQLNLEAELATIGNDPLKKVERRALSRALWGYFIFEKYLPPNPSKQHTVLHVEHSLTVCPAWSHIPTFSHR